MPARRVVVGASFEKVVYSITLSELIENGEASVDLTSSTYGGFVTITTKACLGYEFDSVNITDADGTELNIPVNTINNTQRSFRMPASNIVINVRFKLCPFVKVLPAGTDGTAGTSATYLTFGEWPQTIKSNDVTIDENDTRAVGCFTYCKGSDGAWYVKIHERNCFSGVTNVHPTRNDYPKYSDGSIVEIDTSNSYRWFKVEPIKWRLLTDSYVLTNSGVYSSNGWQYAKGNLLLSESILVACKYYDNSGYDRVIDSKEIKASDYNESRVRAFLNGLPYLLSDGNNGGQFSNSEFVSKGFLQTAFNQSELLRIEIVHLRDSVTFRRDIDVEDKIFLLNENDVANTDYGFGKEKNNNLEDEKTRYCFGTDFGLAYGFSSHTNKGKSYSDRWMLRTGGNHDGYFFIDEFGSVVCTNGYAVYYSGVRPALCLGN